MQRESEGRGNSIHTGRLFDGFGSNGSMMSSIFGGRDPFDDPFFTRPFSSFSGSSMFGSSFPFGDSKHVNKSKGPVIEELNASDVGEEDEEEDNETIAEDKKDSTRSSNDPLVEHPDDQVNEEKSKDVCHGTDYNRVLAKTPQTQSVSFRKVTYGGINGAYYTATTSRKTGSDGVMVEESKQADITTGQATHRICRGLHDKGHSVTRKLNSDGKVDTMQTLHNLNEDDFAGFEEAWKGASSSGQSRQAVSGGCALPFADWSARTARMGPNNAAGTSPGRRPKKVVTINIE